VRSLTTDVVADDTGFAGLADAWSALRAVTPHASAFQSFAWIDAWRALVAPRGRQLHVLVLRDGGEPVAILPCDLGARGDLRLLGEPVSNYQGPLHRPERVTDLVHALAAHLTSPETPVRLLDFGGLPERSPFFSALRALDVPGWSAPAVMRTATCPYVDLAGGWTTVLDRRTSASRRQLARKWKTLARLGRLEFHEVDSPARVRELLPELFTLFRQRWEGRHESGGFAGRFREFHLHAAPALAAAREARISHLALDGHVVAFYYAVRADGGTASYVIGHDGVLGPFSPGQLMLIRALEAACVRGEREYDLSLGEESYKDEWASGARGVFRLLAWRRRSTSAVHGRVRAVAAQAWVRARSVGWLRDLRREGLRRTLAGPPALDARPDAPGIAAGGPGPWTVHSVESGAAAADAVVVRAWSFGELRDAASPRLLALAAERFYRGDPLLAVYRDDTLVGVVWRACPARRALVTHDHEPLPSQPVYYHPLPVGSGLAVLVRTLAAIDGRSTIVTRAAALTGLPSRVEVRFVADLRFAPLGRARAALSTLGALHRGEDALDVARA